METTAAAGRAARPVQENQPSVMETDLARAKRHFETAREHFNRVEFEQAIAEFQKAYDLSGHPELLYNIGLCHENLHNTAEALRFFKRYLVEMPYIEDERKKEAEAHIYALEKRLQQEQGKETTPADGEPAPPAANLREDFFANGGEEETEEQPQNHRTAILAAFGTAAALAAASGTSFYLADRYQNQHESVVKDLTATGCINNSRWNSAKCQNQNQGELNSLERKKKIALGISIGTGTLAVGAAALGGLLLWNDSRGNSLQVEPQLGSIVGLRVTLSLGR